MVNFDADPEDGRKEMPYYLYGLVFCVGLAIAVALGWFFYLKNTGATVP